ncbi:1_Acyl_sn_Glycerol_3_P acylTase Acyltransferase 3 [Enterospora canceri]|uniref:1_Acyl_sn_Glycerol_3_P acylTase Acyltransferase 3 n=1 Tax=Enterospora canceri TaxID=1081671 RepID=A0A1Y1S9G6_9MICR|nr:1_Acyl_sn_Glycerol_3_P acylTase Acyltransferase 3 [Enterospora canceri]
MKMSYITRFICFICLIMGTAMNILLFNLIYKLLKVTRLKRGILEKFLKFWCYHVIIAFMGLLFTRPFYFINRTRHVKNEKNIAIFNHCSEYDWIYILMIYYQLEMYEKLFILMKMELKKIPVLGYIILQHNHLFVNREKNSGDKEKIKRDIDGIKKHKEYTMFIFPEGTIPTTESCRNGQEFAKKSELSVNNEPFLPKNVLVPKVGGFNTIKTNLEVKYIIDGTIFNNPYYFMPDNEQTHVQYFFKERLPISPIILIQEVRNEDLADDFVYKSFYTKEKMIERYKEMVTRCPNTLLTYEETKAIMSDVLEDDRLDIKQLWVKSKYRHVIFLFTAIMYLSVGCGAYKATSCLARILRKLFETQK